MPLSDLNPLPRCSPHHNTSLPEETLRSLCFCENHISKLDLRTILLSLANNISHILDILCNNLSGPKLLLVPFKPSLKHETFQPFVNDKICYLVVLDEEVTSLSMREEGRAQLTVVTITRNWPSLKNSSRTVQHPPRDNLEVKP